MTTSTPRIDTAIDDNIYRYRSLDSMLEHVRKVSVQSGRTAGSTYFGIPFDPLIARLLERINATAKPDAMTDSEAPPTLHAHVWQETYKDGAVTDTQVIEEVDIELKEVYYDNYHLKDSTNPKIDYFQFGGTIQGKYVEIRLTAENMDKLVKGYNQ